VARARELAAEPPQIRLFHGEELRLDDFTDTRTDKLE